MNNDNIIDEELLEKIMTGVAIAGNAKSLGKEALEYAKKNDFEKANEFFKNAKKEFFNVHECHFDFIKQEASGEKIPLSLLLIHMEDHIMTTSIFLDTVEDYIELMQRVYNLEKLYHNNQ